MGYSLLTSEHRNMFSVQEIHRSSFSEAFLFQLSDSSHTALESFTHIFSYINYNRVYV